MSHPQTTSRHEGRPAAPPRRGRTPAAYALGAASAGVATLLMFALYDIAGLERGAAPFIFYFAAVAVSARYLGRGPALLTTAVSAFLANYFFIPPFDWLSLTFAGFLQVSVFLFVALIIVQLTERSRRAEAAAVKSERQLATTLQSIGDAVISTDAAGRVNFMNPVAQRLTGWAVEEARGLPLEEVFRIVNEETRETVESPVAKVLREGKVVGLANHTVLLTRGGAEIPIEDSGAPIAAADGRTTGVVLVFHDVSERRRAEEASERLAAIVESSEDAVIGKTLDGTITSWNAAAARLYGYTAEEAVGRHISLIIPEERASELDDILRRIAGGEGTENLETERVRKDGTRHHVSVTISPVRDAAGRITGASSIAHDISGRKRAEEERAGLTRLIEGERRRLRDLVASVPGVVWEAWGVPDVKSQRIDFVSDYVETMLGYTVNEWLSTPNFWLGIVHPEDRERAAREAHAIYESRIGGTSEFRWVGRDGRVVHVEARSTVILDERGESVGMRGVTMDISARKLAEAGLRASEERYRELAEANAKLYARAQEVNRAKDEFLAVLSHELRTPLTPILGWTHMIRSGRLPEPEAQKGVAVIEKNSQALSRLINDLLDMSSILSGKMKIERAPVELNAVLREAAETVRPEADRRRVALEVETGGLSPVVVAGDRTRLVQVFWNLLNNAVKFSQEGGSVRVRLSGDPQGARVEVEDDGDGIDPDFLPHVFERFRQADMRTTRIHGGLGIGLALVKSYVEAHGGRVSAASDGEGRGSRFVVTLPAGADGDGRRAESQEPAAARPEERAVGVCRVLLIEDSRDTLDMLRVVFAARGYAATACGTPEDALSVAESGHFDIIVSDIGLPRVDGYELLGRLRALPHLAGVPAVALTGYAAPKDAEAAFAAGFDAHVPKPVDPTALGGQIEQLLKRKRNSP
ncbi:MAG TPA: PAS domain S-box protein [Pyrinomonadaceae bacterium]|nr:PAS domain S-box protein [Pyrinomonadaceae bacterium]